MPTPPPYARKPSIPEIFLKQRRVPQRIFCRRETGKFRQKRVTPIIQKNSAAEPFWKTRVRPRNFSTPWDKKITENRNTPLPIHPKNIFDAKFFLDNRRVPSTGFSFRSCESKVFSQYGDVPPLLCINIFDTNLHLKDGRVSLPNFWRETKVFSRVIPYPLLMYIIFRHLKFSENLISYPMKFFGTLRFKEISTQNSDFHFLFIKVFNTQRFLEHWRVPLQIFSTAWNKMFR